jgi:hypothetical protein
VKGISTKIKRKINASGEKPCEICSSKTFLQIHHINGRDIINPNHSSNLANICPNCHNEIHNGKIIIEGWFMTTEGKKLFWHYFNEEGFTGTESTPPLIPRK